MAQTEQTEQTEQPAQPAQPEKGDTEGGYLQELHVALVVALVVICVVLGVVGWELHPKSNGFQPVS